jgi:hypothetical protein
VLLANSHATCSNWLSDDSRLLARRAGRFVGQCQPFGVPFGVSLVIAIVRKV